MSEFRPILLTLPKRSLALEILPYGLTLHRILVQADGRTHDIVIGPESPENHVTQKYTNSIIGRYANRIPVSVHVIERHGIKNEFTPLANENPRVSLHGGPKGFDTAIWTLITTDMSAILFTASELRHFSAPSTSAYAIFRLISPGGDQGYPGKLIIEVLIALIGPREVERKDATLPDHTLRAPLDSDLGSIVVVYRAKLDEGEKELVTPINLTQHWGFNLDASLRENIFPSVKDHILTIKADRFAELDPDGLSAGTFHWTADHPSHMHASKRIGERFPEKSYDDFYLFHGSSISRTPTRIPMSFFNAQLDIIGDLLQPLNDKQTPAGKDLPEPVVELASSESGIRLTFDTNQQGVMFYANASAQSSTGARKKIHGGSGLSGNGDAYGPESAAFLEFHAPLAAFLDPKNKDGEDSLLTTNELYNAYVRCNVRINALH